MTFSIFILAFFVTLAIIYLCERSSMAKGASK
ncbi:hypothetical protein ADLP1_027 [Acinetobacter phage vB_AbaM_DLP1]|uniref:Uncharacterized protein n=3 Tax=Lazarusvirus TaxID=2842820 RepID=A0A4Y1NLK5_9CAUD|nr:hypothetical protein HYQ20_gp026 [Acinetobacter phage vB_AbaM_Berthold]YP_009889658.1 hypothetical protein HYP65_gp027 [Acinetobacter phage AM101]QKN87968.1 hypothetical protein Abraxas_029 [Acinetobacter phage Abraxas]WBF78718.1 hypothetical protein ADLP1_027 [Acinetobacter phage vB_AbaM_DLP1]AWY10399.1 hypothetical protein AM101_027 [Acinetobacter phage AM101]QGZ15367.1 hypothetical protein Berthold_026 [Acinetobacter phage vB_AbaM_Berthold]